MNRFVFSKGEKSRFLKNDFVEEEKPKKAKNEEGIKMRIRKKKKKNPQNIEFLLKFYLVKEKVLFRRKKAIAGKCMRCQLQKKMDPKIQKIG